MFAQFAAQVEHGIARRVKPGDEFIYDDQDFRFVRVFELGDDLLGVLIFGPVTGHHFFPELDHLVCRPCAYFFMSLPHIRRGDDDLG